MVLQFKLMRQFLNPIILLAMLFCVTPTLAANHFYLSGTGGVSFLTIGNTNPHIQYDNALLTDAYPITKNSNAIDMFGISGGYEFSNIHSMRFDLGVGLYTTPGHVTYKGQLIETANGDSSSPLYYYQYHLNTSRIMLEGKLISRRLMFKPFIDAGIGAAWNQLNHYQETPIDPVTGCLGLSPYQSHTNHHFAYQLGIGVSYAFNAKHERGYKHERLSLGYRYVSLGENAFITRGVEYPYTLNIGKLTSNEIYLNYTHLF